MGATTLEEEIRTLGRERDAVILAHNYQRPEVQEVADFVGDSLYLSRKAIDAPQSVIVFAGVRFMAETAKILNPTKTVLLPDPKAGCGLADSITAEQLRTWKAEHPGAVVVAYINTSAEVKAESDYCCTSSNAIDIVRKIPEDKEILFLPDIFLGEYVRSRTGRNMHLWMGDCPVHAKLRPEHLEQARAAHPGAPILAHPECGCSTQAMGHVDRILSTDGMVRFAEETRAPEVIVATEVGILHRMRKLNPGTKFTPLSEGAICPFMKEIDLVDVRDSLALNRFQIDVPTETATKARRALERMVAA
ncbi:MAG: quinolinate synthase NadA [Thermoplasmata archaeon]|nr:quinolinate synthase NadA [Thermoplasmata archaeon]MCI4356394.1 quinolinate synthase NadA [Thermoplasmata archaeon]